jgi:hypothetical protein
MDLCANIGITFLNPRGQNYREINLNSSFIILENTTVEAA